VASGAGPVLVALAAVSLLAAALTLPLALYLGLLAILARPRPRARSRARPTFAVLVPAHDEQAQIVATVRNLLALDYPRERFAVFVVADNCSDKTAALAADAGAHVLERHEPTRRGKGYALAAAFDWLLAKTAVDAIVVVDADTVASENLLRTFAELMAEGADAMQAEYGVRNVEASWRTRLMTVAMALYHRTRALARARMGLSVGLRGNGMCFTRRVLQRVPHQAHGLVEDAEYAVQLALAGYTVAYAADAYVRGEMVSRGRAAVNQRRRWESGRAALARQMLPAVMREAWRRRSLVLADAALDLLLPPLSNLSLLVGAGLLLELITWRLSGIVMPGAPLWIACALALLVYVARGLQYSGLGWRAVTALAYAPVYVGWKLLIRLRTAAPTDWIRTGREAEQPKR
jgi:1,2-diacylglycerol 3-beta-glucosyltransferase